MAFGIMLLKHNPKLCKIQKDSSWETFFLFIEENMCSPSIKIATGSSIKYKFRNLAAWIVKTFNCMNVLYNMSYFAVQIILDAVYSYTF